MSFSQGKETEVVARKNVENEKVVGKRGKEVCCNYSPPRCNYIHVNLLLKQLSFTKYMFSALI